MSSRSLVYLSFFLFSLNLSHNLKAQSYPQGYFRSPLDIPLYLAGNFGELRSNHFHTGLDFKTEGREGLLVFAAADGWVSRIKVSAFGYGNIVYVDHPNGYTTAYAHLSAFNPQIANYTKNKHYQLRSFEIDIPVKRGELPLAQGDILGFSGNSGGSGGPHLHFEIRDTRTELALNPLLFGLPVADNVNPSINNYRLYALSNTSWVDRSRNTTIPVEGKMGYYLPERKDTTFVWGEIGFALHATDMLSGSPNKCGVYNIELYVDDSLIHTQRMEKLDFNLGKYINAHTDYLQFKRHHSNIHKCYLEPNNKLPIYPYSKNRGKVIIRDEKAHPVKFYVRDVYGNTSVLHDTIYGRYNGKTAPERYESYTTEWTWNRRYAPQTPDYGIDFPAENLYRNELVKLFDHGKKEEYYSNLLEFGNDDIPVNGSYQVRLAIKDLPDSLSKYAFLAQLNENNHVSRVAGTKRENGFMKGSAKTFGRFAITLDKNPPSIRPVNIEEGKSFDILENISFIVTDGMTGIETYQLLIDDQWALITYDAKYHKFTYTIDPDKIFPGPHRLFFTVADGVGNTKTFECNFSLR